MMFEVLNVIGTIAFALSGVLVAMEERYDLMGVYILGFITAFGGGAVRNLLIGLPVSALWDQGPLFTVAFVVMSIAFVFPKILRWTLLRRGIFFDAIGLGAFSVQGALFAQSMGLPLSACIAAAALTGTGGGMIRDVLAGRKPLFLQKEIYIAWTLIPGVIVGLGILTGPAELLAIVILVVVLRLCSVYYNWRLPNRAV
ncbi:trimeric intracellular cation channel family protein [Paenalkalicoccus suaedae]|uniref:Trimeric intracellular cation channel family protein n=1 Tax=Paenalkalicoccus suaedae TaxID=2592382 RepID=A0A859FB92_9BACI|nr:trimeric intracellular cation channel family protein [Paenalkalicoccus suaedae]QKS70088.1 trimeric intracellular cation channel family protein [Paenalkalicoccus suaedae]